MNKRILPALLILIVSASFFACKKHSASGPVDTYSKYFPTQLGKYVVYNVDSTIYTDTNCKTVDRLSQLRYSVTDTFRDSQHRLSYLMDVNTRPNANSDWQPQTVIYVTPTSNDVEVTQTGLHFIKLVFPIIEGGTWKGNSMITTADSANMLFNNNWTYTYQNYGQSYNNGLVNFGNTVSVLENDQTTYSNATDSAAAAITARSYAREVYAANVGMIYKQLSYYTISDSSKCKGGFSVIMQAVEHN